MAILHPQECWLLERAMSVEYYRKRYEAWRALVELCEYQVAEWAKACLWISVGARCMNRLMLSGGAGTAQYSRYIKVGTL